MTTRAVHLELAVDYSTIGLLQALRRFFAIRGQPALIVSDHGTQLVGAEWELKEMIRFEFKGTKIIWSQATNGMEIYDACLASSNWICRTLSDSHW